MERTIYDEDSINKLNACLELTDWDMFIQSCGDDINELTDVVTSYISFYKNINLSKKSIKQYPNNKPWIDATLRKCVVHKHRLFKVSKEEYSVKQKQLEADITKAKYAYKRKVEELFRTNSYKDAWKGLKELTDMTKAKKEPALLKEPGSAERINKFYARFDNIDFSAEHHRIRQELVNNCECDDSYISEQEVYNILRKINSKKAAGPDKISGKLIRSCRDSLLTIVHYIFNLSFRTGQFPSVWKSGEIIPIPKKDVITVDNDLRQVTLTAILGKCLEKLGRAKLLDCVLSRLDNNQFAYLNGRSTDDAICSLIHRITQHLDEDPRNYARALFIDYSSAFNTIQPHLMIEKLGELNVPIYLQLWILDFLTDRTQYVRTMLEILPPIAISTQGCVHLICHLYK